MNNDALTEDSIRLLMERLNRFSTSGEKDDGEALTEMLLFEQAETCYALALHTLTELRQLTRITKLPKVKSNILGVINVRGRIVSVYQINQQVGIDVDLNKKRRFALIGHGKANHAAFMADEIIGTKWVSQAQIKQKPISLENQDYIIGLDSEGVVYLDIDKFIQADTYYTA